MKKEIIFLILVLFSLCMNGCSFKKKEISNQLNDNLNISNEVISTVKVIIDGSEYLINLDDNETTRSFVSYLPQEYNMSELNNNEKYVYLNYSLPTNPYNPSHINSGDVMLYNDNCLVIFYKSFDTNYSYTRIGHIDNLGDLKNGNIKVKFEK